MKTFFMNGISLDVHRRRRHRRGRGRRGRRGRRRRRHRRRRRQLRRNRNKFVDSGKNFQSRCLLRFLPNVETTHWLAMKVSRVKLPD